MKEKINLIAINGSPHPNGNTATVMNWVIEGAKELGAEVNWLQISEMNINYCKGCHSCLKTGKCIIEDDLQLILEKVKDADGVIVGSPVYGGRPTAQLKTLMDRITLLKLYAGILDDSNSIGVATSGIAPTRAVAKDSAALFGRPIGIIGVKCATLKEGHKSLQENSNPKKRNKAIKLGRKLVKKSRRGRKAFSLQYCWINFLRKHLLSRMIKRNKEQFSGVLDIWKEKGWM